MPPDFKRRDDGPPTAPNPALDHVAEDGRMTIRSPPQSMWSGVGRRKVSLHWTTMREVSR